MPLASPPLILHDKETTFGSMTRLYINGCIIVNAATGERVNDALRQSEVKQKIEREQAAKETVFALRNRCLKPERHTPTFEELDIALEALRILWVLLPPLERHKWENGEIHNRTYFLRILKDVGIFRGVKMFPQEK